jgi:BRCT domain type II-containing protein
MAGRYGVWALTAVVAAGLSVSGATAAGASTSPSPIAVPETVAAVEFAVPAVPAEAVSAPTVRVASTTVAGPASDLDRDAITETPTAEVPTADTESLQATPLIMMGGLAMLGFAILLVVRSGSTRQVDETE